MSAKNIITNGMAATPRKEPIQIDITYRPDNRIEALAIRYGLINEKRVLVIPPSTLGTLGAVSALVANIQTNNGFDNPSLVTASIKLTNANLDVMVKIICIAIKNKRGRYSKRLFKFIKSQFTPEAITEVVAAVYQQLGIPDFIMAVSVLKGYNILETKIPNPINR